MEDDDDGPPMLVSADGAVDPTESSLSAEMEDIRVTRVPITIITGMYLCTLNFAIEAHLDIYP